MAKILSPNWSIIRGSIAGITYTANRHAAIVARQRVAPTNPNSNRQVEVRSSFAEAGAQWSKLSPVDKEDWKGYAQGTVYSGPTGNYTLTGRTSFIASFTLSSYMDIIEAGIHPVILTAPLTPGFLNLGPIQILPISGPSQTGFTISVTNSTPEDVVALINVSRAYSNSRFSDPGVYDPDLTQLLPIGAESSQPLDILNLEDGLHYFIKVRGINSGVDNRIASIFKSLAVANAVGP